MRSSGPASAMQAGHVEHEHSTPRASASTFAWGAKSGATTSARISPKRRVAQRLLAIAHDLLDGGGDGAHALDLDERPGGRPRRGTRGRRARRRCGARARPPSGPASITCGARSRWRAARAPAPRARAGRRRRAAGLVRVHRLDHDRERLAAARAVARGSRRPPRSRSVGPGHVVDRLGPASRRGWQTAPSALKRIVRSPEASRVVRRPA